MQDLLSLLNQLQRPRILIRAARHGVGDYRRESHLRRLLGDALPERSGPILMRLIEVEALVNGQRERNDAGYSIAQHVELLIAMMGEARLLRASTQGQICTAGQTPDQSPG